MVVVEDYLMWLMVKFILEETIFVLYITQLSL